MGCASCSGKSTIKVGDRTTFVFTVLDHRDAKDGESACNAPPYPLDTLTNTSFIAYFQKPDDSIVNLAATFRTDGSDGVLEVKAPSGFIDTAGMWWRELRVQATEDEFTTDRECFEVVETLASMS